MKILTYISASLFSALVLLVILTVVEKILSFFQGEWIDALNFYHVISSIIFFGLCVKVVGDHWRTSEEGIGTGVTNLPNPFFDPDFSKSIFRRLFQSRVHI